MRADESQAIDFAQPHCLKPIALYIGPLKLRGILIAFARGILRNRPPRSARAPGEV